MNWINSDINKPLRSDLFFCKMKINDGEETKVVLEFFAGSWFIERDDIEETDSIQILWLDELGLFS